MAAQYEDVSSLPSAVYRDYILSYVDMWDHYVIYQSEQYEYIGYIWDDWGHSTLIEITRQDYGTGYNYRWRTEITEGVQHDFTITEPMYAYSTEKGLGQYYMPQNFSSAMAMSQLILTVTVALILVFRRVFLWKR